MTNPGRVKMSPEYLRGLANDLKTLSGKLNTTLTDLQSDLKPVLAAYIAESSEEYQRVQKDWDNSATDLNNVLTDIANATFETADTAEATESRNRASWSR